MFVNDDVDDESAVCRTLTLFDALTPSTLQRHKNISTQRAALNPAVGRQPCSARPAPSRGVATIQSIAHLPSEGNSAFTSQNLLDCF